MPRTVDHIVNCHIAATELRKAGKPVWNRTVKIKQFLREDPTNETPEHVASVSVRIAKALRAAVPASYFTLDHADYDGMFVETVEMMEECTVQSLAQAEEYGSEPIEELNDWLGTVYDWADVSRIWLE